METKKQVVEVNVVANVLAACAGIAQWKKAIAPKVTLSGKIVALKGKKNNVYYLASCNVVVAGHKLLFSAITYLPANGDKKSCIYVPKNKKGYAYYKVTPRIEKLIIEAIEKALPTITTTTDEVEIPDSV